MNEREWEKEIEFRDETFGLRECQVKALESIAASLNQISKVITFGWELLDQEIGPRNDRRE
jgi:hypothetical protein